MPPRNEGGIAPEEEEQESPRTNPLDLPAGISPPVQAAWSGVSFAQRVPELGQRDKEAESDTMPCPNPGAAAPPTNTTAPPAPAAAARRPKAKRPSPLTGHAQQWACLVRDCAISLGRKENNVKGYTRPGVVSRQVGVLGEEATAEILLLCEDRAPSGPADGAAAAVDTLTAAERERVTSLVEAATGKLEKQDVFSKAGFRAVAEVYGSKTTVVGKIPRGQTSVGQAAGQNEPGSRKRQKVAGAAKVPKYRSPKVSKSWEPPAVSAEFNPEGHSFITGPELTEAHTALLAKLKAYLEAIDPATQTSLVKSSTAKGYVSCLRRMVKDSEPWDVPTGVEMLDPTTIQKMLKVVTASSKNKHQHGEGSAAYRYLLLFCGVTRAEITRRSWSPASWPRVSLMSLKRSRSI